MCLTDPLILTSTSLVMCMKFACIKFMVFLFQQHREVQAVLEEENSHEPY